MFELIKDYFWYGTGGLAGLGYGNKGSAGLGYGKGAPRGVRFDWLYRNKINSNTTKLILNIHIENGWEL